MTRVALDTISCNCHHKVEDRGITEIGTDEKPFAWRRCSPYYRIARESDKHIEGINLLDIK
jgi:hypothetical protein